MDDVIHDARRSPKHVCISAGGYLHSSNRLSPITTQNTYIESTATHANRTCLYVNSAVCPLTDSAWQQHSANILPTRRAFRAARTYPAATSPLAGAVAQLCLEASREQEANAQQAELEQALVPLAELSQVLLHKKPN